MASENRPPRALSVTIVYNGLERPVPAQSHQAVQALLEHGMNAFGVHQNRHLMALWTDQGIELTQLSQSLAEAGVVNGMKLLLRPSAVRGGVK
jgi:shikimate 5-dehydrogenase